MGTSIVGALASIIGYFAARALDGIIGKWVAYINVAWNKAASKAAREEYAKAVDDMKQRMAGKYDDWAKWREGEQ